MIEILKVPGKYSRSNWDDLRNFMKEGAFNMSLEEWKDFNVLRLEGRGRTGQQREQYEC